MEDAEVPYGMRPVKNVMRPRRAEIEVDCRTLPGTDEPAMRAEIRRRIGEELWAACEVVAFLVGEPVDASLETELYATLEGTLRDHDPDGVPLPIMAPFARPTRSTPPGSASPPTGSRHFDSTRPSGSSSASMGSTNGSASKPCGSVCRSSTTSSGASAAEPTDPPPGIGEWGRGSLRARPGVGCGARWHHRRGTG